MEIILFIIILISTYTLAMMGLLFIVRVILDWFVKRDINKWRIDNDE